MVGVEPILEVRDLTLRFGGNLAISEFDLDVRSDELLSIVGPNGAGKTSLFNCISGVYKPQHGSIRFDGIDVLRKRPHELAQMGIGRTFQSVELFKMTVLDNVLVGRHVRLRSGVLRSALFVGPTAQEERRERQRAEEILEFLDIGRHRHESVEHLPLSVQKRVEIGRALALDARLLLLDEPTAGMGRGDKEDVARIILKIRRDVGIPLVLIEHDMRFVMDLSDRVCVMNFGEVLVSGLPAEVSRDERVIQAYLGSQGVQGEHAHD